MWEQDLVSNIEHQGEHFEIACVLISTSNKFSVLQVFVKYAIIYGMV